MKWKFLAFLMGISSELYLAMPGMGILPMFDIFSYGVSLLIILVYWRQMGPSMHKSIIWGFCWAVAALVAGLTSDADAHDVIKQTVVVSSSWALISVAWWILRHGGKLYLIYLIGYSIGAYIGLHYFKQGAWLSQEFKNYGRAILDVMVDKQRYPIYANLIFYGITLSCHMLFRGFPILLVFAGCVFCGLFLLVNGGSRSNFGFYMVAAFTALAMMSGRRFVNTMVRNKGLFAIGSAIVVAVIFTVYKSMAQSGSLGEDEYDKYQEQFVSQSTMESGLLGRAGFSMALEDFCNRPWGSGPHHGQHSVIMSAMAREGVVGLCIWIYFLLQVWWFVRNRLLFSGRFAPFLIVMVAATVWACLGSPFGYRHMFFVLWAYIALCKDNPLYGCEDIFENFNMGRPHIRIWGRY